MAGAIWTFIATKFLFQEQTEIISSRIPIMVKPVKVKDLESLSLNPFFIPKEQHQANNSKKPVSQIRKKSVSKYSGRFVGAIKTDASLLAIVEIDNKYYYLQNDTAGEDYRLLRMFADDSIRILYLGDTLMLYKNEYR